MSTEFTWAAFGVIVTAILALFGYAKSIADRLQALEVKVARDHFEKSEVREMFKAMKDQLDRIEDKVNRSVYADHAGARA